SFEALAPHARSEGIPFERPEELIGRPEIIDFYRKRIDERTKDLGQVEKIKRFTLMATPFSQENGEITPTMKIKRKVIEKKYGDIIDAMYRGGA
ncbi:MAG TPA: long-chain fatty acid--CoA ligase, partial [Spirochaetota bacterium]|nr:long-chain fatty acid--CoA ligase [Spirochaetota bacterium]